MTQEVLYGLDEGYLAQKKNTESVASVKSSVADLDAKATAINGFLPSVPVSRETTQVAELVVLPRRIESVGMGCSGQSIKDNKIIVIDESGNINLTTDNGLQWTTRLFTDYGHTHKSTDSYHVINHGDVTEILIRSPRSGSSDNADYTQYHIDTSSGLGDKLNSQTLYLETPAVHGKLTEDFSLLRNRGGFFINATSGGADDIKWYNVTTAAIGSLPSDKDYIATSMSANDASGKFALLINELTGDNVTGTLVIENTDGRIKEQWTLSDVYSKGINPRSISGNTSDTWFIIGGMDLHRSQDSGVTWEKVAVLTGLDIPINGPVEMQSFENIVVIKSQTGDKFIVSANGGKFGFDIVDVNKALGVTGVDITNWSVSGEGLLFNYSSGSLATSPIVEKAGLIGDEDAVFNSIVLTTEGGAHTVRLDLGDDGQLTVTNGDNVTVLIDTNGDFISAGNVRGYVDSDDDSQF